MLDAVHGNELLAGSIHAPKLIEGLGRKATQVKVPFCILTQVIVLPGGLRWDQASLLVAI